MYTTYLNKSALLPQPALLRHPILLLSLRSSFFIPHQSQAVLAIHTWALSHSLEATTLKSSSLAPQRGVRPGEPLFHPGALTELILRWFCLGHHNSRGSTSTTGLLRPEIPQPWALPVCPHPSSAAPRALRGQNTPM